MFCWNPIFDLGSFFFSSNREDSSAMAKYKLSMSCRTSSERSLMEPISSSCWSCRRSTLALSSLSSSEMEDAASKYSRTWTKARMMAILACMAVSLLSIEESIATPSSVKAKGAYLGYFPRPSSKVTNCDLILIFNKLYSSRERVNIKSSGNLPRFLRTACFNALVSTPYSLAKS